MTPMLNEVPEAPLVGLVIILLLIEVSASALDAALARITRTEAAEAMALGKNGTKIAHIVESRTAARVAVTSIRAISTITAGSVLALVAADFLSAWWQVVLFTLVVAIVLALIMGVFSPRKLGRKNPVKTIGAFATPLAVLTKLFAAFVQKDEEEKDDDDLAIMMERVSESDELEEDERILLQSVMGMRDTMVREVMVPRTDMITIHTDTSLDKAISLFVRSGYSRIPVTGDTVDDVAGVLYVKDIIRRTHRRLDTDELTVSDVMRQAVFVPEMKPVDDVLHDMQAKYFHMALVVDEYGGIAGLVTMEDLLEELVGKMVDEHDRAAPEVEQLGEGIYRVPARLPIDELGELFGLSIEDDDVDTAGGLLAKGLGQIPISGSETDILGLHLQAERFEGRRKRLATLVARVEEE